VLRLCRPPPLQANIYAPFPHPHLFPEDGGSMALRNVGILPQHYTASQAGRHRCEFLLPWKHQMSHEILATLNMTYNLKHSHRRRVCNCPLINNISYTATRCICNLTWYQNLTFIAATFRSLSLSNWKSNFARPPCYWFALHINNILKKLNIFRTPITTYNFKTLN
jgi:hypothetical protein